MLLYTELVRYFDQRDLLSVPQPPCSALAVPSSVHDAAIATYTCTIWLLNRKVAKYRVAATYYCDAAFCRWPICSFHLISKLEMLATYTLLE